MIPRPAGRKANATPPAARAAVRLRRAVLMLARRLRPALQSDGVSTAKLSVIGHLYRAAPQTPTELAGREGVKLASLTRLVAELERDGWITREPDPSDGRRSLLRLTALGRKRLVGAALAADGPLVDVVSASLSAEELRGLNQACTLLERIGDALAGSTEPPPSTGRRNRS